VGPGLDSGSDRRLGRYSRAGLGAHLGMLSWISKDGLSGMLPTRRALCNHSRNMP